MYGPRLLSAVAHKPAGAPAAVAQHHAVRSEVELRAREGAQCESELELRCASRVASHKLCSTPRASAKSSRAPGKGRSARPPLRSRRRRSSPAAPPPPSLAPCPVARSTHTLLSLFVLPVAEASNRRGRAGDVR